MKYHECLIRNHMQRMARSPRQMLQPANTIRESALDTCSNTACLLLAQDEAHVLQGASGHSSDVAASDIFALAPIKAAVQVYSLKAQSTTHFWPHHDLVDPSTCSQQHFESVFTCNVTHNLW